MSLKMLITNQKCFSSVLVIFLMVLSIQGVVFGQQESGSAELIASVSERTPQVRDAIVAQTGVNAANINATHLKKVTSLDLRNKSIISLKAGDFSGLTALTNLNLSRNQLHSLPVDIFKGLTSLKTLRLGRNAIEPLPIAVSLQKVAEGQFKAVAPTGAPFDIVLPINIVNGNIAGSATTVVIPRGSGESSTFKVSRLAGMTAAVTVDIGTLPECPSGYYGCDLSKSGALPIEVFNRTNTAPMFREGEITTRVVLENIAAGERLGKSVSAVDPDGDSLTYTLGGIHGAMFELDSENYLRTRVPLYYENGRTYLLTITASDGYLSDTIIVVTRVIGTHDAFRPTGFTPVSERTPQVRDAIVSAVPGVHVAEDVTSAHLATITNLNLRNRDISELKSGDFSGLSALKNLNLRDNHLTRLPDGIFNGLTALQKLRLDGNAVKQVFVPVYLQQVGHAEYKAVVPTGAPFDIILPVTITDGIISEGETPLTISQGSMESEIFAVTGTLGSSTSPTVALRRLPKLPSDHYGYTFAQSTVYNRTPQVADAITAAIQSVNGPRFVTDLHLLTITTLHLNAKGIKSLKPGDFAGMPLLHTIFLNNNRLTSLPDGIFDDLTSLTHLYLSHNQLRSVPDDIFDDLSSLEHLDLSNNKFTSNNNKLTDLPARLFKKLPHLRYLNLKANKLTYLLEGIFEGITEVEQLRLDDNPVDPLPLWVTLEKVGDAQFKAVVSAGAPFTITLPITVENGSVANGPETLTIWTGEMESQSLTVRRTADTIGAVTVDIPILPSPPEFHIGYVLVKSDGYEQGWSPLEVIEPINVPPVFTEGDSTVLTVAENIPAGVYIGDPITATDANKGTTLVYTLGGADAASFDIDGKTGQLKTKTALDYETKSTYSVIITVDDRNGGSASIAVTVNITDINETPENNAPVFTEGSSATRSIAENTDSDANIGTPITATDSDGNILYYFLGGTDATAFSLNGGTGQLKTLAALDYETKSSYSVTITVSDGNGGSASIAVTINITDIEPETAQSINVQNNAPVFTEGNSTTRSVAENTNSGVNIGTPVTATDADGNTLIYRLGGDDAASFSIDSGTGQLKTHAALDYETKSTYTITITAFDENGENASIAVTINVTDINEQITRTPINEQPGNNAPVFTEGSSTTRSVAENMGSGINIDTPVTATDADGDTLTYGLGGADANAFSLNSKTGQLKTHAALDYETKATYTITITASDGKGESASIAVTINVTDINEQITRTPINEQPKNNAPVFTEGSSTTRSVAENTSSGVNIGMPVDATDPDGDALTYSLGGTDVNAFTIVSKTGQLKTNIALDYEIRSSYSITITAADGNGESASIAVTINITRETDQQIVVENRPPVFTEGSSTTRSIAENTASGTNIGSPVSATDADDDTLTYSLGGTNANAFTIVSKTGRLKTKAALDHETKSSYSVTITADDGNGGSASINVKINIINIPENVPRIVPRQNRAPVFMEGSTTTRSIAENTAADTNIGSAVTAIDADSDTLTYGLTGTDAKTFSIGTRTGQLQTSAALDYETKSTYTVRITAADGKGGSASIDVTINITDIDETPVNTPINEPVVNNAPVFTDGSSASRYIAENTPSGSSIGAPVSATDPDGDTLTYSLGGTDAASFSLDSGTGQLQTKAALDYDTKPMYTVTVTADDGNGNSASITVTINVTIVNGTPVFKEGSSTTRSVAKVPLSGEYGKNVGAPVTATDPENDKITYYHSGTHASRFTIDSNTGQLKTSFLFLNSDPGDILSVKVQASDGSTSSTIDVTINVDNSPIFSDGSSTTRSIAENSVADSNVGLPVTATDPTGGTLTYSLGGDDAASFYLSSTTGQLKVNSPLDYEKKSIYSVTVTASNTYGGSKSITVTVNVTNVNEAPVFTDGTSTTRKIRMNPDNNDPIGSPVAATDPEGDTLTYSKSGTKAHLFGLDTKTGQLKISSGNWYSGEKITMTVTDGTFTDTIEVTIEVDVTPVFSDGSTATRSIAKDATIGTNIGSPITAKDPGKALEHTYEIIFIGEGFHRTVNEYTFSIDSNTGQLKTKHWIFYNVGVTYSTFKVRATNSFGGSATIDVEVTVTAAASAPAAQQSPAETALLANYPNPFNPETWIPYQLSKSANVTLAIYNVKGEMVRRLALGHKAAGSYLSRGRAIYWDGKNQSGEKVSTGVYFYRLIAGDFSATRKMLILK